MAHIDRFHGHEGPEADEIALRFLIPGEMIWHDEKGNPQNPHADLRQAIVQASPFRLHAALSDPIVYLYEVHAHLLSLGLCSDGDSAIP